MPSHPGKTLESSSRSADFTSAYLSLGFCRSAARWNHFAVDALGHGSFGVDAAYPEENAGAADALVFHADGQGRFSYRLAASGAVAWSVECTGNQLRLRSALPPGQKALPAFELKVSQKANHATLLGHMRPGERQVSLPAVLHLPDQGSLRISGSPAAVALGYDARRFWEESAGDAVGSRQFVQVLFPGASSEFPIVEYTLAVAAIHPALPGLESDPLFDGFRRNYLSILQLNPHIQMLANNASSDPCAFTVYQYAEIARRAPALCEGLHPLDIVRATVDRYISGAKGYGMAGYGPTAEAPDLGRWKPPYHALDALPSLVIAGCYCAQAHENWAQSQYDALAGWGREIFAMDRDGNGLIEYPQSGNSQSESERGQMHRPSNWWDAIMFGHEDAYANALAYKAALELASLALSLGHAADASFFTACAERLKSAYLPAFLCPRTGLLAGWRSADGQLHDYSFTFVSGTAISYGLVEGAEAHRILDAMVAAMERAGFRSFQYGLPGNLEPIRRGDYYGHAGGTATRWGEPTREDGSDGFQIYENGGATACHAYFTYRAFYALGRTQEARRLYLPVLKTFAEGGFQGFDASGLSIDWRDWSGGGHGYEGFLVDNYMALLAVFDEVSARSS